MNYVIVCKERSNDGVVVWWRPYWRGYTADIDAAGYYAQHQAAQIYRESWGDDFPVPVEALGSDLLLSTHVCESVMRVVQTDLNRDKLKAFEEQAARDYRPAAD